MIGIVIKSTGSFCTIKDIETNQIFSCKVRGKIRMQGLKTTNPVAVGDRVDFDGNVVNQILPRTSVLKRKSINLSKQEHIIAANIDQCILFVTIKEPETQVEFIDRFLVTSQANNIDTVLVFNKIDLYSEQENLKLNQLIDIYKNIGYTCIKTSTTQNIGILELKEILKNKTSLISGNSGVGKSTMVQTINPNINLRTGEISNYSHAGKHTTTFAEMFEIMENTFVIDTPGIKGFGLIDFSVMDIAHNFREFFIKSCDCKFNTCTHTHEPGCAVKQAVENGEISMIRYKNYLSIIEPEDNKYRSTKKFDNPCEDF